MSTSSWTVRGRCLVAGVVLLSGWCASAARASFPQTPLPPPPPPPPPFTPPPPPPPVGVSPEPPIFIVNPPPPPVASAPEPGTVVLGLIGAGVAGLAARRRRQSADESQ
jgi:PEP-CTERM motif